MCVPQEELEALDDLIEVVVVVVVVVCVCVGGGGQVGGMFEQQWLDATLGTAEGN